MDEPVTHRGIEHFTQTRHLDFIGRVAQELQVRVEAAISSTLEIFYSATELGCVTVEAEICRLLNAMPHRYKTDYAELVAKAVRLAFERLRGVAETVSHNELVVTTESKRTNSIPAQDTSGRSIVTINPPVSWAVMYSE